MRTAFLSNKESLIYPFIDVIPFPTGLIKNIKIAEKENDPHSRPFVSAIVKTGLLFSIEVSDSNKKLGEFIYEGDKFININNLFLYGFVLLGYYPLTDMNYRGIFNIHRSCYTSKIIFQLNSFDKNIQNICINDNKIFCPNILKIKCKGQCNFSVLLNVIHLRRSLDPSYSFFLKSKDMYNYVYTVNGEQCLLLVLSSTLPSAILSITPVYREDSTYVLYINTLDNFPTCLRQRKLNEHT